MQETIKTPEALEAARLIDRLPEHERVYLRDMLYRVSGASFDFLIHGAPKKRRLRIVSFARNPTSE